MNLCAIRFATSERAARVMSNADITEAMEDPRDLLRVTPDIPLEQLEAAASSLGQAHMALQDVAGRLPVALTTCAGVVAGCFVFSQPDTEIHVSAICVVKTASANSYLSHDLIHLLGYSGTADEYQLKCQGKPLTCRKRQSPDATSIIGLNFINQHKLIFGQGSGFIYDKQEDFFILCPNAA